VNVPFLKHTVSFYYQAVQCDRSCGDFFPNHWHLFCLLYALTASWAWVQCQVHSWEAESCIPWDFSQPLRVRDGHSLACICC